MPRSRGHADKRRRDSVVSVLTASGTSVRSYGLLYDKIESDGDDEVVLLLAVHDHLHER
jgi:hypothetical protein